MKAIKDVSAKALVFLETHRLAPSPRNYCLAYAIEDGDHPELSAAVARMTDGGVRLNQTDADSLCERYLGRTTPQAGSAHGDAAAVQIRHQTLRLADLTAAVSATTGDFSRELAFRLPDIAQADVAGLQDIFMSTLARSRRAEEALAATTAEVEQLRQKLESVQGDAERDQLTGLANRRGIDVHLAKTCKRKGTFSLAMCDIDRFKSYNDRYGHIVGDRVLKTVAASLAESLHGHFVGRWGGEEFLMVIEAALPDALTKVEEAKAALGVRHFKLRETDEPLGRITFSAGVVALPTRSEHLEATLAQADALLYRAKCAGRDRICTAHDENAPITPESISTAR